jgi:hypothetical protein
MDFYIAEMTVEKIWISALQKWLLKKYELLHCRNDC